MSTEAGHTTHTTGHASQAEEAKRLAQGRAMVLSATEQRGVTRQVALALLAGGLLILSTAWHTFAPADEALAQVLAGLASLVVAGPVFAGAWHSLKSPSLHGVTDRLIALAMLAAWAVGDI